jgi:pyrroline-5-carboxylate reductase
MGSALMTGAAKAAEVEKIYLANRSRAKAEALAAQLGGKGVVCGTNNEAAASGDYLFLGVEPKNLDDVLDEIEDTLKERAASAEGAPVIVSMAAGRSIESVQTKLPYQVAVVRIMPNTPCAIGEGAMGFCASSECASEKADVLVKILENCGLVEKIDEKLMDALGAVSGCGPAFVYLFIEALADGGVRAGLSRPQAQRLAAGTVRGAASMVLQSGLHPGALKDAVCSPSGSTIAGVQALEEHGFRAAAMAAVCASYNKTVDMGKTKTNE